MIFNKKRATAEMTTALLCRSNISKNTFKTVAEYLEDDELRHILDVCISTLDSRRGVSQDKVLAELISKTVSKTDSFDSVAEHIDNNKLQSILSSCGAIMVSRKHKKPAKAVQNISPVLIIQKEQQYE